MANKNTTEKTNGQKGVTIALIAFLVLAVLIAAYSILRYNTGVFQRSITAVTVGDQKLSVMDVRVIYRDSRASYLNQYGSLLEMYGTDLATIDTQQCLFDSSMTWGQYFLNQGLNSAVNTATLMDLAVKDGREVSDNVKAGVKANIESIKDSASKSGVSVRRYLSDVYGKNTSLSDVENAFTKQYFANEYYKDLIKGYKEEITDEQVSSYYEENKKDYDLADFYSYSIKYSESTDEAEQASLKKDEAKLRADLILSRVNASNFDDVVAEYEGEDFTSAFSEGTPLSNSGKDIEWILDGAENGSKTVIADEDSGEYTVVLLVRRYLPEDPTVNVRHILFKTEELAEIPENATDEEKEATEKANAEVAAQNEKIKEKAQKLLEELASATSEEFAAAALEYSEDTGSKTNGGLYENVKQGEMVEAFNDWCFDESRQPGDTGLVETEYGFHVMFFESDGEIAYVASIKDTIASDKYQEFINEAVETADVKVNQLLGSLI